MRLYPVELRLEGRNCLLVGGGKVAERKAMGLLAAGGNLSLVSPRLTDGLREAVAEGRLRWQDRTYRSGDLEGVFLVIAATDDPATNDLVSREAQEANVLCNVVDDPARCNFVLPAVLRRGDFSLSVSTGGNSPLLARLVREELEGRFGIEYGPYVRFLGKMRAEAMGMLAPPERETFLRELVAGEYLDLIRRGFFEQAEQKAEAIIYAARHDRNQVQPAGPSPGRGDSKSPVGHPSRLGDWAGADHDGR